MNPALGAEPERRQVGRSLRTRAERTPVNWPNGAFPFGLVGLKRLMSVAGGSFNQHTPTSTSVNFEYLQIISRRHAAAAVRARLFEPLTPKPDADEHAASPPPSDPAVLFRRLPPPQPQPMSWDLLKRFLESDVFNQNPFLSVSYLSCAPPFSLGQPARAHRDADAPASSLSAVAMPTTLASTTCCAASCASSPTRTSSSSSRSYATS